MTDGGVSYALYDLIDIFFRAYIIGIETECLVFRSTIDALGMGFRL